MPPIPYHPPYEVSIVCSVSVEDSPGRTWLGSSRLDQICARPRAVVPGAKQGPGLPGLGSGGSREVRYGEGQAWAAPVLALKLGLEMLPAGSAAVRIGLGSLLGPVCGDVQRPPGKA